MQDTNTITVEEPKSKSKALPLFIFLFLASLALSAFLFFKYAKNAATIKSQNEELTIAYGALNLRADSIQKDLDFALQNLQDKINENLALTDLKEDLRQQLEAKSRSLRAAHARITRLINGEEGGTGEGGPRNLLEAKNEIANLQATNSQYIAKVEQIQQEYEAAKNLAVNNGQLATTYKINNDSLIVVNRGIEKKLTTASILRVAGLKVEPIRTKKGKQEVFNKASKVERIRVYFSVLASELTEKEDKDIRVRIIEPDGAVMTKNNNKLKDKDQVSSLEESITYDGTEKGVTFYYKQNADFKKGLHKVELYHGDKLLDRSSFSLR